jgi:methionyl-tRNA synthetase
MEKFKEAYNANLANGIGNLFSRVMKMATANNVTLEITNTDMNAGKEYDDAIAAYDIKRAADHVWSLIQKTDQKIQNDQPFKVVKNDPEKGKAMIASLITDLHHIAKLLLPILPSTAETLLSHIKAGTMPPALFPRKE